MIIAGCTASAVSVPARGMRLLSPLASPSPRLVFGGACYCCCSHSLLLLFFLCSLSLSLCVFFFGLFGRSLTLSMSLLALQLSFFIRLFRCFIYLLFFSLLSTLSFFRFFVAVFLFLLFLFNCISHVVVAAAVGGAYHFRCCLNCFSDFLLPSPHALVFFSFFLVVFFGIFMMFTLWRHWGHLLSLVIDRKSAVWQAPFFCSCESNWRQRERDMCVIHTHSLFIEMPIDVYILQRPLQGPA